MRLRCIAAWAGCYLFIAGGCATYRAYPGPRRPAAEIAVLAVPVSGVTFDDQAVPDDARRIEMLAGRHRVEWTYAYPNGFREPMSLTFEAAAGKEYRLNQRFFPVPHPGGPLGALADAVVGVALFPVRLVFPEPDATAPPPGDYFKWVAQQGPRRVVAGLAPEVPVDHAPVTYVPVDEAPR